MSAVAVVSRQAMRLAVVLLVCASIAVATSSFLQTPLGTAALSAVVRRGGPEGFQAPPNAIQAAGPQRVRGAGDAGPREGGGRLLPNVRAGLPEVLRSAGTMGLLALGVVILLNIRNPRRRARPVPVRSAAGQDFRTSP